jgi:uncharacterized protein
LRVYLDASFLVALLRNEQASAQALRFAGDSTDDLIVSDFAIGEAASAVARLVRMQEVDEVAGLRLLASLDEWTAASVDLVATLDSDIRHAAQLVRRFELHLRMPDAIHLASTVAMNARLATFDQALEATARKLGIELVDLGVGG